MPSTNKLSSRTTRSVAKFLLSFCGLASFGVVTKLVALGTAFLVLFAIPVSITLLNTNNTYATGSSNGNSNTITANLPGSVAIRLLDSTGTTEISSLDFNNLTPTPQGTTASKSFIVDVATSNPTGYKLYMQSDYQDSNSNYTTNLTHTDADVTDNIPTLVPGSGSSADTKVYWNYVNPLTNSGSSNPTPSVIPPYGTPDKIAQYFSPTNSHQSTIDINVGIDTTIVSGTYENQLLFSAVGNPTTLTYKVSFNTAGGTPAIADIEETAAAGSHAMTLPLDVPAKTGGLFTHWLIPDTNLATCNNTNICHPGDTIVVYSSIDPDGDFIGEVTLTAQYTTITTMQAMTPAICDSVPIGASTTLTDTRDNKTYTIKKLKDNNCWMTQNLDFLPTAGTTISSATSNVALTTTLQNTDSSKGNYLTDNCSDANIDKYCIAYSNNAEHPEYGTYYNWYAATSGTGTSTMVSPDRATSSICPKGWRLPTGGEGGEFQILYDNYSSWDAMLDSDGPHFIMAGYHDGTSSFRQGEYGNYWSSSAHTNSTDAYFLRIIGDGSTVNPARYASKHFGPALRCLAHDNSYSILGVDPNGGTWSGSTSGQTFTQAPETTQNISNPTNNATYSISYDMGSTGLPTPTSPTSAERAFTGWTASLGEGATFVPASGLYTYGTGNSSLVAQYNATSNSFNLPTLSKTGYTCKWHQGSASGAEKQSNVTITGNTTFYAVCVANELTLIENGDVTTNTGGWAFGQAWSYLVNGSVSTSLSGGLYIADTGNYYSGSIAGTQKTVDLSKYSTAKVTLSYSASSTSSSSGRICDLSIGKVDQKMTASTYYCSGTYGKCNYPTGLSSFSWGMPSSSSFSGTYTANISSYSSTSYIHVWLGCGSYSNDRGSVKITSLKLIP